MTDSISPANPAETMGIALGHLADAQQYARISDANPTIEVRQKDGSTASVDTRTTALRLALKAREVLTQAIGELSR